MVKRSLSSSMAAPPLQRSRLLRDTLPEGVSPALVALLEQSDGEDESVAALAESCSLSTLRVPVEQRVGQQKLHRSESCSPSSLWVPEGSNEEAYQVQKAHRLEPTGGMSELIATMGFWTCTWSYDGVLDMWHYSSSCFSCS